MSMVHQAARRGEAELDGEIAAMMRVSVHPEGVALAVSSSHDFTRESALARNASTPDISSGLALSSRGPFATASRSSARRQVRSS